MINLLNKCYTCFLLLRMEEQEENGAEEKFKRLITKGKLLISEGRIQEALACNKKAYQLCNNEKLKRKIEKMEVCYYSCNVF